MGDTVEKRRLCGALVVACAWFASLSAAHAQKLAAKELPKELPADYELAGAPLPDIVRFLNVKRALRPSPSPDGARVAYVSAATGSLQVWVATASGTNEQITFADGAVQFLSWSPSGEWIAYGADRQAGNGEGFYLISHDGYEERELLPPSRATRVWGGWSADGRKLAYTSNERNGTDMDVYIVNVTADGNRGQPQRVYAGKGQLSVETWSPSGSSIVISRPRGETDNDLYLLDLASGRLEPLLQPADAALHRDVVFVPDGKSLYVISNQQRDMAQVARRDLERQNLEWWSDAGPEVERLAQSPDGKTLAYTTNDNGFSTLHLADTKSKKEMNWKPSLPGGVYGIWFAARSNVLAVEISGPNVPGDIWLLDLKHKKANRATRSTTGGLNPIRFVVPEPVKFRSWDAEPLYGLLYLPVNAKAQKPPVLLHFHGGPSAQARPTFDPALQYLVARGIAILDLNYRGSTGYGKRYTRLDDGRQRPNQVRDVASALNWLAEDNRVDVTRAATMGGSYGGYLALASVAGLPERFRGAISLVGVTNWVTSLKHAPPELRATDRVEYGNIDDAAEQKFFTSISPITMVKKITAPLLLAHGALDTQEPPSEPDQFVNKLREAGGEVEYLRFPDEGHGIRKQTNRVLLYRRISSFLQKLFKL